MHRSSYFLQPTGGRMLSHEEVYACRNTAPFTIYGSRRWWFSTCRPLFRATSFCGLSERGLMARKNRNHRRHEYVISFPARPFRLPYDVIVWTMYPCHHDQDARYYRILICKPSCSSPIFSFFFSRLVNFEMEEILTLESSRFSIQNEIVNFEQPIHEASVCFASASRLLINIELG